MQVLNVECSIDYDGHNRNHPIVPPPPIANTTAYREWCPKQYYCAVNKGPDKAWIPVCVLNVPLCAQLKSRDICVKNNYLKASAYTSSPGKRGMVASFTAQLNRSSNSLGSLLVGPLFEFVFSLFYISCFVYACRRSLNQRMMLLQTRRMHALHNRVVSVQQGVPPSKGGSLIGDKESAAVTGEGGMEGSPSHVTMAMPGEVYGETFEDADVQKITTITTTNSLATALVGGESSPPPVSGNAVSARQWKEEAEVDPWRRFRYRQELMVAFNCCMCPISTVFSERLGCSAPFSAAQLARMDDTDLEGYLMPLVFDGARIALFCTLTRSGLVGF